MSGVFPGTIEGQRPNPIPGGLAPFAPYGVFIHHNPLNPANPLSALSDPNQITDFNGFVGLTHIRGAGTGTNTATGASTALAYQADMGFSEGAYLGVDGKQHQGTFVFVWLDVYAGPVGSAKPNQQIHDYNVHIDSNDVFWMVRVVNNVVEVNFAAGQASVRMNGVQVFDDHDIGNSLTLGMGLAAAGSRAAIPPVAPKRATVSFDIEWTGTVATAQIDNDAQNFQGTFLSTGATINWSAEQDGFMFQSEPPDPTRNLISVLGFEQNGVFHVA